MIGDNNNQKDNNDSVKPRRDQKSKNLSRESSTASISAIPISIKPGSTKPRLPITDSDVCNLTGFQKPLSGSFAGLFGDYNLSIPVDRMANRYTPYPNSCRLMEMHDWISFGDLRRWVRNIRSNQFNVKASRDMMRTLYDQIEVIPDPFSETKRFPMNYLVWNASTPVSNLIDLVLNSIDLPDRAMNKDHVNFDLSDAKKSFEVAVQRLNNTINAISDSQLAESGIYSRDTFEASFGATWVA